MTDFMSIALKSGHKRYEIEILKSHKMIECRFKGHPKKVTNAILRVDKPIVIKRISDKCLFLHLDIRLKD